ncbi:hypothetical protein ACGYLE_10055 [Sulfitobacter sp. 1A15142]
MPPPQGDYHKKSGDPTEIKAKFFAAPAAQQADRRFSALPCGIPLIVAISSFQPPQKD